MLKRFIERIIQSKRYNSVTIIYQLKVNNTLDYLSRTRRYERKNGIKTQQHVTGRKRNKKSKLYKMKSVSLQ